MTQPQWSSFLRWALGVLFVAYAGPAAAEEGPTYSLSWSRGGAAETCIGGQALAKQVESKLGRPVFVSPSSAELSLEGRIERKADGWSATLALYDRDGTMRGQRDLTSAENDCRVLDRALVLMAALTIDPRAAFNEAPIHDPPPPPAPAITAPLPAPTANAFFEGDTRANASAALPSPRAHAEAGARLAFGLLPNAPGAGIQIAVGLPISGDWMARIGATTWSPSRTMLGDAGAIFSLSTATVAVCQRNQSTNLFLLFCTGLEPGILVQAGYGFSARSNATVAPVFMLTTGVRGALRLVGPLWAQLGGDVVVPIVRDQFYYLQSNGAESDVFRMAIVGGAIDASVLFTFP